MTDLLDTNLNQSPYFDDFSANSQYNRVLFKPSIAVQARELTTLQTMLQHQIGVFGENIFVEGTIVSGCSIAFNSSLSYVKLQDNYANGSSLTVSDLVGYYAVSNNGLTGLIRNSISGYVSQSPNLNTIYVSYLNSSANGSIKVFQNDEVLSIVTSSNVLVGSVTVANTISSGNNSNTTGYAYVVGVDAGVIFQKGCFLTVEKQNLIINAYSNYPDQVSVGFNTVEEIVTAYQDNSLFDNAQGSPNYSAPGADRLKLVPTLVAIPTQNNTSTNNFFSIVDFASGVPTIVNQDTQYATIGKKMAQISSETNGNFVINPFNIRTITNYYANGGVDPNNIKLEIDPGLCYVDGYRLQTLGKLLNVIPKGLTVNTNPSQIVTTQLGNYITVCEYGGVFNYAVGQVSLRNAPAYAISNNAAKGIGINSVAAPGSQIGTAYVLASVYNSGTIGSNTATYNLYLYNIQMNSGQSFASTRCIVASKGICDVQLTGGTFQIQNTQFAPMIYDFNQAAIKTLKNSSNTIDAQFEFVQSTNVVFSNSGYVSVTIPTYVGGNNVLPFGTGGLTTPQEELFTIVAESNSTTSNIAGFVAVTSGQSNVTGSATAFTTSLWPGAYIQIANSTAFEIKQVLSITNNTFLTLAANVANTWSGANVNPYYFAGMVIPTNLNNTSITISSPNTFTVNLNTIFPSTVNASITYPIQRLNASPLKKDLQTSVFVKINCGNNVGGTTGPWCLGVPDVFSIANVWVGTTYSNSNPSYTSNFTIDNGQRDQFYGLAFLKNNGIALSNTQVLLVQLESFLSDSSSGAGFFSVDSYPVDDTGVTANSIYTADIPVYISNTVNASFNLRNCVDFRIYAQNTIPYISNVSLAVSNTLILNPANTLTFGTPSFIPLLDAEFESSTQSYNGRYDVVGFNNTGVMVINFGIPSENPVPPGDIVNGITLATINIPPYPSLTVDDIDVNSSKSNPTVSLVYRKNRRYNMQDIGSLDARLTQVEYYTALSVLEQSTQNLLLTSASGANRFQNGILADPFNDFSISNTLDPEYNCAIDGSATELRPTFTQFLVNLQYANSLSNNVTVSNNGRLITLADQQIGPFISQQFASQVRNCAEYLLYTWVGNIVLTPEGDYQPDTTINPDVVVDLDSYSNWVNLANAWQTQWGTWEETGSSNVSSTSTSAVTGGTSSTVTTTTTTTGTQTGTQLGVTQVNNDYSFGDVVTSIALQPYCRANLIRFSANGLKPSTQFWPYLDDVSILQYCAQTDVNGNILSTYSPMTTDANGYLYGIFYLPADTFRTGNLNFQLIDVADLVVDANVITSLASVTYYGTNLAYTQNNLDLQTTTAQLSTTTVTQTTSTTSNSTATTVTLNPITTTVYVPGPTQTIDVPVPGPTQTVYVAGPTQYVAGPTQTIYVSGPHGFAATNNNSGYTGGGSAGAGDPLAQSFSINLASGLQGIYVNSIDLFFQTKHQTLGIMVEIREMVNGFPGPAIVPFSQVHLTPSQINISTNSSLATNIVFGAPVLLLNGQDYCFVIIPDGSNSGYNIFTAAIGGVSSTGTATGKDLITGAPIYALSSTGILFLSSGNSTWTPYQNEMVKFNLYQEYFTQTSGWAAFTNDDSEYFTLGRTQRTFQLGEQVLYSSNYTNGNPYIYSGNVSVSNSSLTVTVPNTSFLTVNNTLIFLQSNTNNQTFCGYATKTSGTTFTLTTLPFFTDANASIGLLTPITGFVKSVNTTVLTVSNSNVTTSAYLLGTNNQTIFGRTTGASATITGIVDIPYDTFMPKFSTSVPSVCILNFSMLGTSNSYNGYVKDSIGTALTYGTSYDFNDQERVVMSKSNEMHYSAGVKSLITYAGLQTYTQLLSPALDTVKLGAVCIQNLINGDDVNSDVFFSEISNSGNAINKYVSLTVNLAAGLDAEDLVVYIGAYWPAGTSIYVYGKILNQYDPDPFDLKPWSPMYTNNLARSSKVNSQDFNEYMFSFVSSSIPPFGSANNTAYIDTSNSSIVAYYSPEGQYYSTFDTFAIKIVLLSNAGSYLVPRLTDMRAIATTA